jgi:chromosome segregation ATPase
MKDAGMSIETLETIAHRAEHRANQLESELDSLRDQLADFRDTVLTERGALAESGMTCDQINAVLSEFDDLFIPDNQGRAELESALAAAQADARRYRWLRSEFKRHDAMATVMLRHSLSRNDDWVNIAGALDDAIDDAMLWLE